MYIIVGLGNPTKKFEKTRHNAGFDTLDILAKKLNIKMNHTFFRAKIGKGNIGSEKVILVKPQTYMNSSGESLKPLVKFYRGDPSKKLLVIYDDIDLDIGKIRIRAKGSAGSHNGMKSVIENLKTENFARIRIGVGHCPKELDLVDFVLGRFSPEERKTVETAMEEAANAVYTIINEGVEKAQNDFN